MTIADLIVQNLLTPIPLSFLLGVLAIRIKSDLKLPDAIYTALSIYLLYAIGLKGGAQLARSDFDAIMLPTLATLGLGLVTPAISYLVARRAGRLSVIDSAALAAHYGSVSAVTFMAALSFLVALGIESEGYTAALVAILEIPAIIIAITIARIRGNEDRVGWSRVMQEVLSLKSVLLLFGGLCIGFLAGESGYAKMAPFFVEPFYGVLALFLIEMGILAGQRLGDLRKVGIFLILFGILVPLLHGALGVLAAHMAGMTLGGATILGTLTASASYIAAPAAVRTALHHANPTLYLTASLGVTFPFNIILGIPCYLQFARWIYGTQ